MDSVVHKIAFEPEDLAPPSYYYADETDISESLTPTNKPVSQTSKLDKSEWWKAPEFVPRSQTILVQPHHPGSVPLNQEIPPTIHQSSQLPLGFSCDSTPLPPAPGPPRPLGVPPARPLVHPPLAAGLRFLPRPALTSVVAAQPNPVRPTIQPAGLLPPPLMPMPPMHRLPSFPLRSGLQFQPRPGFLPPIPGQHVRAQFLMGKPFVTFAGRPPASAARLPPGYTANMTSINSSLGPPIPAIVLKKRRKKRARKNKAKTVSLGGGALVDEAKDSHSHTPDTATSKEDFDDDSSSFGLLHSRRSEPDLTKLSLTESALGAGRRPNDALDLDFLHSVIEGADGTVAITGSCPDLSESQRELLDDFWELHQMPEPHVSQTVTKEDSNQLNNQCVEEYEISSPPVFNALQDAATDGKIRSTAVKALDKQVIAEMDLPYKLDASYIAKGDDDEDDDAAAEDRLYERLIKDQDIREKQYKNPGKTGRSIQEELEEKELLFPEKVPVQMAAVHRNGEVKSIAFNSGAGLQTGGGRRTIESLFPPATYFDDEEDVSDPMHITVNSFEDPEELVIDECTEAGKLSQLHDAFKNRFSNASVANGHALQPPKSQVCCSVM